MATINVGGYDYSFVDKILDRFTCEAICTKVLKDPHLTLCCGQHFCESCLNNWFIKNQSRKESCPHCRAEGEEYEHFLDKKLKREVDALRIYCTNKEEGCQWIGELGSLKDHLKNLCSYRQSQCTYCGINGMYQYISSAHVTKECPEFPLECPNKCGVKDIKRKDMKDHRSQCPEEFVECTYGCKALPKKTTNVLMRRKHLEKHLGVCQQRPFKCQYCELRDNFITITKHYGNCNNFPLECPNKCGRRHIKRSHMKDHRSQCPEEPVQCPFEEAGCKEKLVRRQLEQHMSATQQQHKEMIKKLKETERKQKLINKDLGRMVRRMEQKVSSLQEALENTSSDAEEKILRLKQNLAEVETKKGEMEKEISELQQSIQVTKESMARNSSRADEEILKLQENLTEVKTSKTEMAVEMLKLEQKSSTANVEISELNTNLRKVQKSKDEADEEISRLQSGISFLAERNSVLQQELEAANQTLVNMPAVFMIISSVSIGAYFLIRRYIW